MSRSLSILIALGFFVTASLSGNMAIFAQSKAAYEQHKAHARKDAVHEQILIKAPPKVVWQSMIEQRKVDPDSEYVKSVNHQGRSLLEQKFKFPSPFGDAECILHLAEIPAQRVDFELFQSEDLKAMQGSWVLTPAENGKSTWLGLSSYVEPNIFVPRMITNGIISHRVKRNLAMVKKIAEHSSM